MGSRPLKVDANGSIDLRGRRRLWAGVSTAPQRRLFMIQPKCDRPPNLMLIEAMVGAHSGLKIEPPLIVHNQDGSYSEEIKKIYGLPPAR